MMAMGSPWRSGIAGSCYRQTTLCNNESLVQGNAAVQAQVSDLPWLEGAYLRSFCGSRKAARMVSTASCITVRLFPTMACPVQARCCRRAASSSAACARSSCSARDSWLSACRQMTLAASHCLLKL